MHNKENEEALESNDVLMPWPAPTPTPAFFLKEIISYSVTDTFKITGQPMIALFCDDSGVCVIDVAAVLPIDAYSDKYVVDNSVLGGTYPVGSEALGVSVATPASYPEFSDYSIVYGRYTVDLAALGSSAQVNASLFTDQLNGTSTKLSVYEKLSGYTTARMVTLQHGIKIPNVVPLPDNCIYAVPPCVSVSGRLINVVLALPDIGEAHQRPDLQYMVDANDSSVLYISLQAVQVSAVNAAQTYTVFGWTEQLDLGIDIDHVYLYTDFSDPDLNNPIKRGTYLAPLRPPMPK